MIESNPIPKLRFQEFTNSLSTLNFKKFTKINQGLQIPISKRLTEPKDRAHFYITNEFLKEGSKKAYYIVDPPESVLCTEEDILMTRTGNTGQVVTNTKGAFHNNFFKIKYDIDTIDKDYFVYYLRRQQTQYQILRYAGTSTIPDINHGDFYKLEINLPSLVEQQKIASFLSAVDQKIKLLEQKKSLLEQYKKGVMQKLFSREIRFKPDGGGEFPEWEELHFKDILKIGSGKDYKHLEKGDIPVYGTGGHMTFVNDYLYNGTSVGIGRKGTIDKPQFLQGKFWTVDTLFFTHSFNRVIPYFVYLLFQRINWQKYNEASGVPSLSKGTIEKIRVQIPCLNEQAKIVELLKTLDRKIDLVQGKIVELEKFKKGLLQQMFV